MASQWADTRPLTRARQGLGARIDAALEYYPAEILIVHRDAEGEPVEVRRQEILDEASKRQNCVIVPLVPVRMQEAWFLFDEGAIRRAAGNPGARKAMELPPLNRIEQVADPKSMLIAALRTASGLSGRRLKKFSEAAAADRVAQVIASYEPLRRLRAFRRFEDDLVAAMKKIGAM